MADLDRLYDTIRQQKGRLDMVFVNAGTAQIAPLGSISEEHYDQIFNTNVKGVVFTVQKALPLMGPGSTIVLNASIVASKGFAAFSICSGTKAAVRNFARGWAVVRIPTKVERDFRKIVNDDPTMLNAISGRS